MPGKTTNMRFQTAICYDSKMNKRLSQQLLQNRTRQQYTPEYLASWRDKCDPLADTAVAALFNDMRGVVPDGFDNLLDAVMANEHPACQAFMQTVLHVPEWVEFADFTAGQALFRRNGVVTFLIGVSVLVSSYGGYKDNKVLALSGRLSEGDSFRRAVETAKFTLDVTDTDALRPNAKGWQAVLQVRLLHARVRQLVKAHGFPVDKYDEPINQEAMCGANMLFSHGVIRALELLGVQVTQAEKESYHALWRYAGWLMGVDLALLPERHAEEAELFELHQYDYQPDADTNKLYEGTVRGIVNGAQTLPLWMTLLGGGMLRSRAFVDNFIGLTVNDKLQSYLELRPTVGWRVMFAGLRGVLSGLSKTQLALPPVRWGMLQLQGTLMERMVATLEGEDVVQFNRVGLVDKLNGQS